MRKGYIISLILIITLALVFIFTNSNDSKFIEQDGVLLALRVDGEETKTFPTSGRYYVSVNCSNAHGEYIYDQESSSWKLALDSITDDATCSIDFSSDVKTLKQTVEDSKKLITLNTTAQTGVVNEGVAGFRYVGKEPNNYIWFNDELWRIVGSIPTKVDDNGTEQNLIKIVRNNSIGGVAWRPSGNSTPWNTTGIYEVLNSYYYGKKNATTAKDAATGNTSLCYQYSTTIMSNCDYRGVGIDPNGYYGRMIQEVYWNTGSTAVNGTPIATYNSEITERLYKGKVGMINLSDFGFASGLAASVTARPAVNAYNTLVQSNANWIITESYEWTITRNGTNAVAIYETHVPTAVAINNAWSVRPVVHIPGSIYIISGDGTMLNPYKISM